MQKMTYSESINQMKSNNDPCKIITQTVTVQGVEVRYMTIFVGSVIAAKFRIG